MKVTTLPNEILLQIFEEDYITQEDIISLRLTCKTLSTVATSILFRQICISPLKHDRETFLAICHSPHLAQHVYSIEWQELEWFSGYFGDMVASTSFQDDDETDHMFGTLEQFATDLFWLPWKNSEVTQVARFQRESELEEIISNFRQEFITALNLLPRLHTMISRPMPRDRLLHPCEYPMRAELLSTHQRPTDPDEPVSTKPNCGILLFIFPAMEKLKTPIRTLMWEESLTIETSYSRFLPFAVDSLEHLDFLSISVTSNSDPSDSSSFSHFLDACSSIKHLSLSSRQQPPARHKNIHELVMFHTITMEQQPTLRWSGLVTMAFTSILCVRDHLAELIRSNSQTLRRVFIEDCQIDLRVIKRVALVPGLELESLQIRGPLFIPDPSSYVFAAEDKLVEFINKNHESIEDVDDKVLRRNGAGWRSDPDSIWYNAFLNPDESDSVSSIRDQVFTSHSGARLETYDYQRGPEEENSSDTRSWDGSEDSLDIRRCTCPIWSWDTFYHRDRESGDLYCFQVEDSELGVPTRVWKFISRDGTEAYGNDPLEWFEEWDLEAGDAEQPLPYNHDLHEAAMERVRGFDIRWFPRDEQEELKQVKEPPPGAILYDEWEALETMGFW